MAKLTRVPLKPFAGSALEAEVSQFGSVVEGAKLHTLDIATIQGLNSWLAGFSKSLISGNRYPSYQEVNGVLKVLSYEQAYALQEGIAEYDSATTYYIGSIVKKTGTFELYGSLTDDNVGNALTVEADWKLLINLADINIGSSTFDNKGTVTTDITLAENKITTGYWSGTNTITLPTITDTTKQVICELWFTTATSGKPTITNTNLKWDAEDGGKAPSSYSILNGIINVLRFKSYFEGITQKWAAEYTTFGGVETAFIRPNLSADGILGGPNFAVYSNSEGSGNAYLAVDGNTSTAYAALATSGVYYIFYNPNPIKVTSLSFYNNQSLATSFALYGSNDNLTYTFIQNLTNIVPGTTNINISITEYYNYYKMDTITYSGYPSITELGINAVYIAT